MRAALLVLLFVAGCAGELSHELQPTIEERRATFEAATVSSSSLLAQLRLSTGLLLLELQFDAPDAPSVRVGVVAAVSTDGYVLTAGHVAERLDSRTLFARLGVPEHGSWSIDPGATERLVHSWRNSGVDLALVKVDRSFAAAFSWANEAEITTVVVGLGCGGRGGAPSPFGGRILEPLHPESEGAPHCELMFEGPIFHGDSGGPVTTLDGRLVGVMVSTTRWDDPSKSPHAGPTWCLRPDLHELERLIAEDRRRGGG